MFALALANNLIDKREDVNEFTTFLATATDDITTFLPTATDDKMIVFLASYLENVKDVLRERYTKFYTSGNAVEAMSQAMEDARSKVKESQTNVQTEPSQSQKNAETKPNQFETKDQPKPNESQPKTETTPKDPLANVQAKPNEPRPNVQTKTNEQTKPNVQTEPWMHPTLGCNFNDGRYSYLRTKYMGLVKRNIYAKRAPRAIKFESVEILKQFVDNLQKFCSFMLEERRYNDIDQLIR